LIVRSVCWWRWARIQNEWNYAW